MQRREFVKGSVAAAIGLGFFPEHLLGAGGGSPRLSRAWFEARQGTRFRIAAAEGGWTAVRLAEVRPYDSAPGLEQFEVVLRGAAIEEGTYVVLPEDGDPAPLFLQAARDGEVTASFSLFQHA